MKKNGKSVFKLRRAKAFVPETMKINRMNVLNINRMMVCEAFGLIMKLYLKG